jgi:flagellar protein FlaG
MEDEAMKVPEIQAVVAGESVAASAVQGARAQNARTQRAERERAADVAASGKRAPAQEPDRASGKTAEQAAGGTGRTAESLNAEQVGERTRKLAARMEEELGSMGVSLKFHVLQDQETVQVEVVDPETDKVVRKIPSDEMLKLAENIREQAGGLFSKVY